MRREVSRRRRARTAGRPRRRSRRRPRPGRGPCRPAPTCGPSSTSSDERVARARPGGGSARRRPRRTAAACPRGCRPASTAYAPSWAMASTISTPGSVGRPGKWPAKNDSSPVRRPRARGARSGLEARHLVEEQERRPVRQDVGRRRQRRRHSSFEGLLQLDRRVLRADLVPGLLDLALLVDEEGGADDAHVLAAVVDLLAPHAVLLGDGVIGVGEQGEAERVLVVELLLLGRARRG